MRELETDRLILRKYTKDDVEPFYNNVGSDFEVTKYVMWNKHENISATKELIDKWILDYEKGDTFRWAVVLKSDGNLIGNIDCVKVDIKNKTCEIGYVYGSKFWGCGYATEAFKKVIDYLMNEVGIYTVYAEHLGLNPASGEVMKKCGMTYEGTLKNRVIDKTTGVYDNLVCYSISKGK